LFATTERLSLGRCQRRCTLSEARQFGAVETNDLTTAGHHRDERVVIYRIDQARKSITFSGDIEASIAQRYKGPTSFASGGLRVVP
jgi:hypothetical protein